MSLVTTKIANCPSYQFINGSGKLDTYIFFPGIGELANGVNGKTLGVAALKKHGQPKFFTATWPNIQIIAVQLPNQTYSSALLDKVVTQVKALPNTGAIYASGLSMGAILWAKHFCSDTGARASQFKGCFLMSGNSFIGTKAANFKNLKMVLFGGTLDTTVPPTNYRSIYKTYKAAGVDITYTELNYAHNDYVWNHFSPLASPAIYKGFTTAVVAPIITPTPTPLPPIQETTDMNNVQILEGAGTIDGTTKNIYYAGAADAPVTLPTAPTSFEVWLRNTTAFNLNFNVPLHYDKTQLQTLGKGMYRIFWNEEQKNYWVMHNV